MKVQFPKTGSSIEVFVFLYSAFFPVCSFESVGFEKQTGTHIGSGTTRRSTAHLNAFAHLSTSWDCTFFGLMRTMELIQVSQLWATNYSVRISSVSNMSDAFVQRQNLLDTMPSDPLETASCLFLQYQMNSCILPHKVKYFLSGFQRHNMLISDACELSSNFGRTLYFESIIASCEHSSLSAAVTLLEHSGLQIANILEVGSVLTVNTNSIAIKITKVYLNAILRVNFVHSFDNYSHASNYVSLTLRSSGLTDVHEAVQVAFFTLPNFNRLNGEEHRSYSPVDYVDCGPETEQVLLSDVVTVSVSKSHLASVNETVLIAFSHRLAVQWKTSPRCVFWNTSGHSWSGQGCRALSSNSSHTHCQCDHLTSFAVLVNVVRGSELVEKQDQTILTRIGCILSIICLTATVVTFTYFRNLRSYRNLIHTNLAGCLLVGNVLFSMGDIVRDFYNACVSITIFEHFSYLCAVSWMWLEGMSLFTLFYKPLHLSQSTMTGARYFLTYFMGYGVPFLFIMPPVWLREFSYVAEGYCWLNDKNGTIWSFVGPVIVVVFFNSCVLSFVIYNMLVHSFSSKAMQNRSLLAKCGLWLKGTSMLVSVLGIPWIIGVFDVDETTSLFSYIFIICNSTQGISIFILHCLFNKKVNIEYNRFLMSIDSLPECLKPKPLPLNYGESQSKIRRKSLWQKKSVHLSNSQGCEIVEELRPDAFEMILAGWDPSDISSSEDDSSSDLDSTSSSLVLEEPKPTFFHAFIRSLSMHKTDMEDSTVSGIKSTSDPFDPSVKDYGGEKNTYGVSRSFLGTNLLHDLLGADSSLSTSFGETSLGNVFCFGAHTEAKRSKSRKRTADDAQAKQTEEDKLIPEADNSGSIRPAALPQNAKESARLQSKLGKFKQLLHRKKEMDDKAVQNPPGKVLIRKVSKPTMTPRNGSKNSTDVKRMLPPTATNGAAHKMVKGKQTVERGWNKARRAIPSLTVRKFNANVDQDSPVDYKSTVRPRQFTVDGVKEELETKNKSAQKRNVPHPSVLYVKQTDSLTSDLETKSIGMIMEPFIRVPSEMLLEDSCTAIPNATQDRNLFFPASLMVESNDSFYPVPKKRPEVSSPGTSKQRQSQEMTNLLEETVHRAVTDSLTDVHFGQPEHQQMGRPTLQTTSNTAAPPEQAENLMESFASQLTTDSLVGEDKWNASLVVGENSLMKQSALKALAAVNEHVLSDPRRKPGAVTFSSAVSTISGAKTRKRPDLEQPVSIIKGEMHLADVLAGHRNPKILIGPKVKNYKLNLLGRKKKRKLDRLDGKKTSDSKSSAAGSQKSGK